MLQSPQKLFRSVAVWAVLLVIVLASLSLGARPAWAADTEVSSFKVYDAVTYEAKPAGANPKPLEFSWNGDGQLMLSSTPDGTGGIFYYDNLKMVINTDIKVGMPYTCSEFAETAIQPRRAWNITSMLHHGLNRIQFEIVNNCGFVGNSDIYLVNIGGTFSIPAPAPAPEVEPPAPIEEPPPPAVEPPASSPKVKPMCSQPRLIGVRGSGETKKDFGGYGETVGMFSTQMYINWPGLKSQSIDYAAIPVNPANFSYAGDYAKSVEGGVNALLKAVKKFITACPGTYVLLAGYSQGAEVVSLAYALLSEADRYHIASVTLFGDPRFNPGQFGVNQGDATPGLGGIDIAHRAFLQMSVPPGWSYRVQSYCTEGDPICNFSASNLTLCNYVTKSFTCPHGMYYERGWVKAAAAWALQNLKRMPPL